MDDERHLQLEGWSVAHPLPAPKDHNIVDHDHQSALLQCGHRSNPGLETEVIRMVSQNGRVDLIEDGP